jgi:hypothetical protein
LARLRDDFAGDGWLLRLGTAIGFAWWLLPEAKREETWWLAPAFALAVAIQWMVLDYTASRRGGGSVAFCMVLTLVAAAAVLVFAASKLLADHLAVLAFALLGTAIIAALWGAMVDGAVPALAVALPTLLLMTFFTSETVHWRAFALTASAPLTLVLTIPLMHGPKWLLHALRLLLVLVPLLIAIGIAQEAGMPPLADEWE